MPNSLDEEETQCLLASEDTLASTFCDDTDDIPDAQNDNPRNCSSVQMTSSASSNNLLPRGSDFQNVSFETLQSPSNSTSPPNNISTSPESASLTLSSSSSSKEITTSDYVIPSLAWEDTKDFNPMSNKALPVGDDATAGDGNVKGHHTNLIRDSCLTTEIKPSQKKLTSTSGKPVLQFIRQSVNQGTISKDNFSVDQLDKKYIIDIPNDTRDTTSSKESTPDTFLAPGTAERTFFSVCMEGNGTEFQGTEVADNSNYSTDSVCKQETRSLDSKYSDNDDDKATSIKVVNEILGEIEIDHQRQQLQKDLQRINQDLIDISDDAEDGKEKLTDKNLKSSETSNTINTLSDNDKCNQNTTKNERIKHGMAQGPNTSGNIARSLVVDIHIPPNGGGDTFFIDETDSKINGTQEYPNATRKEENAFRPCKHEMNRSQRCYSDTSHLDKKRKHKNEQDSRGKRFFEDDTNPRNGSKCSPPDYLQNADKIETICESTLHTSNNNKIGVAKSTFIGGFSIAHIKQHFFADNSKTIASPPKNKRKSDSDMDTYYPMPPAPALLMDTNSEYIKENNEVVKSDGVNLENGESVLFSPFSGTKSKVKMSDAISSGFNSCKDLSSEHSISKQSINLQMPSAKSSQKPTIDHYDTETTLVNSNFAPPYSFQSDILVKNPSSNSPANSTKQSFTDVKDTEQSHSLPGNSDPTSTTLSFSIPQLNFPSYFSKNNVSSFLFNNPSQTKLPTASTDIEKFKKERKSSNSSSSPYTFFQMESDDDFDFDVVDDINNPRGDQDLTTGGCGVGYNDTDDDELEDLGAGRSRWYNLTNGSNTDRLISGSFVTGEKQACLSQSSSIISMPVCRICQLPGMEPANHLISPCRCLGSIRYVHNNCLLKWLEVSNKRRSGPPCCELCQYQYLRHKKFVISNWRFPECSLKDKILHLFFVVSVCLMISCAAVTILCFKEDKNAGYNNRGMQDSLRYHTGELSPPEMITLSCGVLFFLAFFLAMYVEVKAKNTVYQLISKFFYMNHEWTVEEYDRKRDLFLSKKKKKKEEKNKKKREQISRQQRARYVDDLEENSDSIET